ncbi:hypothetical protein PMAYCL1PPCAC_14680, partial [Pristionchus mayeri]
EDEEMEEDGEQPLSKRPTRAAAMRPIKREPSPSPTGKRKSAAARAISLPPTGLPLSAKPPKSASPAGSPTVPTASPTVPTCSTVLSTTPSPPVTLDMIFAKICEVHTDVQKLAVRVERVEKKQRDIVNDTVGIRHEVRILNYPSELTGETAPSLKKSVILSIISYEYKCLGVKYGIYEGLTEERVDALDDEDDNCLVFAGNLDRLLFKKSPLPHQQRDQDKVKWLNEVVTHRRCQGPGREKRRMKTQILPRINVNAKRVADRLNRPSPYTPPTLISKTRIASPSQYRLAMRQQSTPNYT